MGRTMWWAGAAGLLGLAVCGWGAPAAADVIDPPGACTGSGTWQEAGFTETSGDHEPSDVIEIPQSDTVSWEGSVGGAELGAEVARREISGEVQVDLPVGTTTIDDWGGSSVRAANAGDHDYKLPDVLIGIEMTLHGEHREDGEVVCSGSVSVVVEGDPMDNPLAIPGIAGMVLFGAGMLLSGRASFSPAGPSFEEVNPG